MHKIEIENALRLVAEARIELARLYLDDPTDEVALATTGVPIHLAELSRLLHAAHENLLNVRDSLPAPGVTP